MLQIQPVREKGLRRGRKFQRTWTTYSHLDCCLWYYRTSTALPSTKWATLEHVFWGEVSSHTSLLGNSQTSNSHAQPLFFSPPSCKWCNFRGDLENFSWLQSSLYGKLTTMAEATLSSASSGHPYSPVTMPCWADLKVANMSGHKRNTNAVSLPWDIYTHQNNSEQKKYHSNGFWPVFNQSTGFRKDIIHNKRRKVRTLTEQPILDNRKHYYSHRVQSVEAKNEDKNQLWKSDEILFNIIFSCCDHMKILKWKHWANATFCYLHCKPTMWMTPVTFPFLIASL